MSECVTSEHWCEIWNLIHEVVDYRERRLERGERSRAERETVAGAATERHRSDKHLPEVPLHEAAQDKQRREEWEVEQRRCSRFSLE